MTSLPPHWALSAAHFPTTNQDSNFASKSGTTRKITLMYLTVLRGYLRHILSALKHPWQPSRNIFQVSTLAPSTVSHAHHSPLRHGGSSLLTWFLSLFLAPAADLLSPQLDQIQETVLRAGSLDGVKSLSRLLSATKVGRWQVGEKTLQVDFPSGDASCQMGWEGLPDTGKGQEGFAELHIHGFGGLGATARHAEARTILPHFFFLSSWTHSKDREKWWDVESSLISSSLLLANSSKKTPPLKSDKPGGSGIVKFCFPCQYETLWVWRGSRFHFAMWNTLSLSPSLI